MRLSAALLVLASVLASTSARADALPEPDHVDPCALANHERPGRECRECRWYYEYPEDHCAHEVGAGYAKACRTAGGPWRTEIWCRDATAAPVPSTTSSSAGTPATTPAADEDDCSTARATDVAPPLALAVVAFLVLRRRIRRAS